MTPPVLTLALSEADRIAMAALVRREIGRTRRKQARVYALGWRPAPGKRDANVHKIEALEDLLARLGGTMAPQVAHP